LGKAFDELLEADDLDHPATNLMRTRLHLKTHGSWAGAWSHYATSLTNFCRYNEAREALRVAARLVGYRPTPMAFVWSMRGDVSAAEGDFLNAETCLRKSLEFDPEDEETRLALAEALFHQERFAEAEREQRSLLESDLRDSRAAVLGDLCKTLRAQERWPEVIECCRSVLELRPESARSKAMLADVEGVSGNGPVARLTLGRLGSENRLADLNLEIDGLSEIGRCKEALQLVEEACGLTREPWFRPARLGETHHNARRYSLAAARTLEAAALEPDDTWNWILAASSLARAGKLPAAEQTYRRATTCLRGDFGEAWMGLAKILRAQERYQEALDCYQRACTFAPIEDDPMDEDLTMALELQSQVPPVGFRIIPLAGR
jgi:tetratricopeptide (TPR) repeat protein